MVQTEHQEQMELMAHQVPTEPMEHRGLMEPTELQEQMVLAEQMELAEQMVPTELQERMVLMELQVQTVHQELMGLAV
jgi:hypothetical protein